MTIYGLFFGFEGRIGRLTYCCSAVAASIVNNIIFWMLGINPFNPYEQKPSLAVVALSLALCWPMVAITAKRYHDLDMSGWWIALPFGAVVLATLAGGFAFAAQHGSSTTMFGSAAILIIGALAVCLWSFWHVAKLCCFAGTAGNNGFGPPPRLMQEWFGDDAERPAQPVGALARSEAAAPAGGGPGAAMTTTQVTRIQKNTPRGTGRGPAQPSGFGRRSR